ncbi:MAG: hypothetical protein R2932_42155 [Caldilineaceae bacterium]
MNPTENGCSYSDGPDANGRIADQRRLNYLRDHFAAAPSLQNGAAGRLLCLVVHGQL